MYYFLYLLLLLVVVVIVVRGNYVTIKELFTSVAHSTSATLTPSFRQMISETKRQT